MNAIKELKILNNKEIKEIYELIENQWGARLKLDFGFLRNPKNRIFVVSKDISKIDVSRLRINSVGMYFCEIDKQGIRLSIEGSQIVGQKATKNVVELSEEETKKWFKGEDLEINGSYSGFVIVKHKNDYLGTGNYSHSQKFLGKTFVRSYIHSPIKSPKDFIGSVYKNGKILNYVGKSRRVNLY